jgi:nucleolar protein 56
LKPGGSAHLVPSFFSILLCDDQGRILYTRRFEGDASSMAERVLALERGELISEVKEVCEEAKLRGIAKLVVESGELAKAISKGLGLSTSVLAPDPAARMVRAKLDEVAVQLGVVESKEAYTSLLHEVSLRLVRSKLKMAVEKQDLFAAQAVTALDELDRVINLLVSRIREWYGYHFPEANDILSDHESFVRLVSKVGPRSRINEAMLKELNLPADKASGLLKASASSLGADLDEVGVKPLSDLASITLALYSLRRALESYVSSAMDYVAPNVKALVGPLVGARLIALAGSLEKLAKLPSSTIQLLGAEKALFRSLRTGAKPPKHGIIFQCPEVHGSYRWQRGKIARALAGKLSIAARVDFFTGEYVADELKRDLEARIKEVKEVYAKPPPKKPRVELKRERAKLGRSRQRRP